MKKIKFILLVIAIILVSCSHHETKPDRDDNKEITQFFEDKFEESVKRYPTWQTYLGRKSNYDKLDDHSLEFMEKSYDLSRENLKTLQSFDYQKLNPQNKLSYDILKYSLELELEGYAYRYYSYPINQMFGYHADLPSFMINMHRIQDLKDAQAYIARLKEFKRVFDQKLVYLSKQESLGIMPPQFVYDKVLDDIKNILTGVPFEKSGGDSTLREDFIKKINSLKINAEQNESLIKQLDDHLIHYVSPAYEELVAYMKQLKSKSTENKGVWSFPAGEDYYNYKLKVSTSTNLKAKEIHQTGLNEVKRIHQEMKLIMQKVGFEGSLKDFFAHMKSEKYQYPNTKEGRKQYLEQAQKLIDEMEKKLPQLFTRFPQAKLKIKPVEKFREKSTGIAFYQGPSLEGNRPGIYYVNLYNMADNPIYKMEALAYHEAIPGHHMQIAINRELKDLPKFRRVGGFTAYAEGWGLYSELIPKEIGFYADPYSDFGRLSMELWRATRLVVDTGIHYFKWSRSKAIKYLKQNTPNAELDITKGVERYFVMPGQATAYKIGMLKIIQLRKLAKEKLKEKFDIREFHDEILKDGSVPLFILEQKMNHWIQKRLDRP